jgi:hypothetical protein
MNLMVQVPIDFFGGLLGNREVVSAVGRVFQWIERSKQ